jgi:hypothetical protein
MEDVRAWFAQPCMGTVETAAASWWRLVPSHVRTVVVRRPVAEVVASLARLGLAVDEALIRRMDRKLDQIERRVRGAISVQFADLADEAVCAGVFEHCLPYQHDPRWFEMMAPLNLQVNLRTVLRYYDAYQPQLAKLAKTARYLAVASMTKGCSETEGLTIQQEPFDIWYRDAVPLFAEHLIATGESPDAFSQKNVALMRRLDQMGNLQVTTARSNGRMFGYLMTVIGPSLEAPERLSAMDTTFFASSVFPRLGMKIQRASIAALAERNVHELVMRAGTRASGPKLGAFYRRLGAEEFGQLYRLELKAA